jgi:Uncharacterised nucleotidyltransferase
MVSEPLAAEFVLAAACCRPPGPGRDEAVRSAAAVDWNRFERLVARHRIEGLAHASLVSAGVVPDAATAEALRNTAGAVAREGLAMAAESARLQGRLDEAGIANLVLKGATLDILAWGRIGLKRSWDIDLLVAAERVGAARTVLEQAGYRLERPVDGAPDAFATWVGLSKEAVFRHRGLGRIVELHWRLTDVADLLPGLSVWSNTQQAPLSPGLSLRTLAAEELFAYLCVHGTSHAWSRLKWLADLGALLARSGEAEREGLYRRAGELGAGRCPATALVLCERLLGVPLPPSAAADIRADRKTTRLVGLALDALAGGDGAELAHRPLGPERVLLSHFMFADGWRFVIAEWRRQWVSLDDRMRLRLPPRLAFLYALVRIPSWVLRRLPSIRPSRAPPEAGT